MIFDDIPFWNLLIYEALPLVILFILFIRSISIIKELIQRIKEKATDLLFQMGQMLIYIVSISAIIGLMGFLLVADIDQDAIFNFMVFEMLPLAIYSILVFGILIELKFMMDRRAGGES
ncbi:hypothetical protein KAU43_07705 [candidate division WOR-3 bacterium]|nr:hypothetical protein [candidate division WOR-3 bacterium]